MAICLAPHHPFSQNRRTNVLLLGPPGVGKTAFAIGLALKAPEAGHRIPFVASHDLVARFRRAVRMDRSTGC